MIHCHLDSLNDTLHAQKLLNHSNCAALISTHFHNLVAEIPPALATPMHMAAIVDEASASVTFLYKLVQGCRFLQLHQAHSVFISSHSARSGQSFGLHCAAAAGLPQSVISGAAPWPMHMRPIL